MKVDRDIDINMDTNILLFPEPMVKKITLFLLKNLALLSLCLFLCQNHGLS